MKKAIKVFFKSILILIIVVFALLLIIPTFFKGAIKEKVVAEANKQIEATLVFDDFSLSLIRNFPNLSFRLEGVEIVGTGAFEGQTLVGFNSFGFVFDLSSLLGKDGYMLKSLILDQPLANAIVLADGSTNWDIMKDAGADVIEIEATDKAGTVGEEMDKGAKEGKELKVQLQKIAIKNGHITYTDNSSGIAAEIGALDLNISGNFSESLTELLLKLNISGIDLSMEGEQYLNNMLVTGDFNVVADLENQKFTLNKNAITVNDLIFLMDGSVSMDDSGGSIITDMTFATGETEFKSLLSMVPAFFMSDFNDLEAEGSIKLDVAVKGVYNAAAAQIPDVSVSLNVNNGYARYKGKPYMLSDLDLETKLGMAGDKIKVQAELNIAEINVTEIMAILPSDTSVVKEVEDTIKTELELVEVPDNIEAVFVGSINKVIYDSLLIDNITTRISVEDGVLTIDNTGLEALDGSVNLNGIYDTRDLEKPILKASLSVDGVGIKKSYDSFVTIQKLAPIAEGMDGSASVKFEFSSLLQKNMMPDLNSIDGLGRLESSEIQLVNSTLFNKFSTVIKLDDKFSNTFKDIEVEFRVIDGRVYIEPFDTKLGDINMTVGGDHGLDQTINYMITSAIPAESLPGSVSTLVSGLAAQAAAFGLKYTPPEMYNVNVAVGGTVKDPTFRPSLGEAGKSAGSTIKESAKVMVEQKVEEVKEVVKKEIDKQVDKVMEEAEKQAALIKAEAAKAAQLVRDEASKNAQKLIDEAESKGAFAKIAAKKAADILIKEGDKKALRIEEEATIKADKVLEEARKKLDK